MPRFIQPITIHVLLPQSEFLLGCSPLSAASLEKVPAHEHHNCPSNRISTKNNNQIFLQNGYHQQIPHIHRRASRQRARRLARSRIHNHLRRKQLNLQQIPPLRPRFVSPLSFNTFRSFDCQDPRLQQNNHKCRKALPYTGSSETSLPSRPKRCKRHLS